LLPEAPGPTVGALRADVIWRLDRRTVVRPVQLCCGPDRPSSVQVQGLSTEALAGLL